MQLSFGLGVGVGWDCVWWWAGSASARALGDKMGAGWDCEFLCAESGSGTRVSCSVLALRL